MPLMPAHALQVSASSTCMADFGLSSSCIKHMHGRLWPIKFPHQAHAWQTLAQADKPRSTRSSNKRQVHCCSVMQQLRYGTQSTAQSFRSPAQSFRSPAHCPGD